MIGLFALVLFLQGASPVIDTGQTPLPALVLVGDDASVGAVREALAARHVPLAPAGTGGAVSARIDQANAGLALTIRDASGRSASHQVATPALAASLIESWMRPDLTGPLLAARAMPEPPPTIAATPVRRRALELSLAGEASLGSEGSLWTGASATAMFGRGRLRVGPLARFAADAVTQGTSRAIYKEDKDAALSRWQLDLLAAAEVPIALGPVWLRPGAAAGAAWLRRSAVHEEASTAASTVRPVMEARVTLTVPLWRGLGLDAGVGAAVAPIAAAAATQDEFSLPAGPRAHLRAGVGVRYGSP